MLSYEALDNLENFYHDFLNGKREIDIFNDKLHNELCDIGMFYFEAIMEPDNTDFEFHYQEEVIFNLKKLFSGKYAEKRKESKLLELVVKGILYTYGVIRTDYFITLVNNYINKDYDNDYLFDLIYTKLNLNVLVERFTINWNNINERESYVSYMPFSDTLGSTCESQKQLNFKYNIHDLDYILKKASGPIDEYNMEFMNFMKEKNKNLDDEFLKKFVKENLLGTEKGSLMLKDILKDVDENIVDDLLDYLNEWHANLETYDLCGYSTNTLDESEMVN